MLHFGLMSVSQISRKIPVLRMEVLVFERSKDRAVRNLNS